MLKVFIIYILIVVISFVVGLSIRINNNNINLGEGTTCEGGTCPPPKGY